MAEVSIANVRKVYGSTEVIHDLSVKVNDGEFVVLVGPSGCGKSTLLRMVAGLESITAGNISIGGKTVNNLPPSERDIAMFSKTMRYTLIKQSKQIWPFL